MVFRLNPLVPGFLEGQGILRTFQLHLRRPGSAAQQKRDINTGTHTDLTSLPPEATTAAYLNDAEGSRALPLTTSSSFFCFRAAHSSSVLCFWSCRCCSARLSL